MLILGVILLSNSEEGSGTPSAKRKKEVLGDSGKKKARTQSPEGIIETGNEVVSFTI